MDKENLFLHTYNTSKVQISKFTTDWKNFFDFSLHHSSSLFIPYLHRCPGGGGGSSRPTIQRLDRLSATATTIEQFFREGWPAKDIRATIEGPLNRAIWFMGPSLFCQVLLPPRFGNATLQVDPIRASWKSPRLTFVPITPSLINYAALAVGSNRYEGGGDLAIEILLVSSSASSFAIFISKLLSSVYYISWFGWQSIRRDTIKYRWFLIIDS